MYKNRSPEHEICRAYSINLTSKSRGFDRIAAAIAGVVRSQQSGRSNFFDIDARIIDIVHAGKVISAIESLPVHIAAWAIWIYGPRDPLFQGRAQADLFGWLVDDVSQRLVKSERKYRPATVKKIMDVIGCLALYRRKTPRSGLIPASKIKKACGIDHANWSRDFREWCYLYSDVFDEFSRLSLSAVRDRY